MGRQEEPTEEERMVMRECVDEAFWYRSLPLASATAILVRYGVSSGRIRPTKHGSWPVVVGATSLAYVLGKLSYIFGDNCHRKFLEKAPHSEIAQELKLRKPDMVAEVAKEHGVGVSIPTVEQRNLGFADVLEDLDFETITEKEKSIMRDCNSIAFWSYSLPVSLLTAGAVFASMQAELVKGSRWSTGYPRLPKMVVGGVLGYMAGQWIYVYTRDCPSRFIQYAPEGEIARRLGSHLLCKDCLKKANIKEDNIEAGEAETDDDVHSSDYVIPSNDVTIVEEIIKDQCL